MRKQRRKSNGASRSECSRTRQSAGRPRSGERGDGKLLGRRGVVLIIVLIVVAALSLSAYSFATMMLAQSEATQMSGYQLQAQSLVASGVESIRSFLMLDEASQTEAGGLWDNPGEFQAMNVVADAESEWRGNFSVLAAALDAEGNPSGVRFGLENESGRINVNALPLIEAQAAALGMENLGRDMLMAVPGMTEEIADAILDWIDTDDEPREFGAEAEHYSGLDPPYAPKNGPLETVEELLLVRDVTPELLFGVDVNRNGLIDASEGGEAAGTDGEGISLLGWAGYLTLYSQENNVNSKGEPRIDLNVDDLQALSDALSLVFPDDWVVFILAYRQAGAYSGSEEGQKTTGEIDFDLPGDTKFNQVLDLIGKKVEVKFKGSTESVVLKSPFDEDLGAMIAYMPTLMDNATVVGGGTIPGRININHAPRDILLGIPGLTEEIVTKIIEERTVDPAAEDSAAADNPGRKHETWLLTEGVVTLDEMRTLMPFLCVKGDVYRAQVVGYYENGRASSRVEVVLDATKTPPRILLWRDLSHLGRGFALETLGAGLTESQQ